MNYFKILHQKDLAYFLDSYTCCYRSSWPLAYEILFIRVKMNILIKREFQYVNQGQSTEEK